MVPMIWVNLYQLYFLSVSLVFIKETVDFISGHSEKN